MPPVAKSGRHAPRTHAACRTCKRRRVKCDLGRPSCARCQKAGFTCEGYELLIIETSTPSPSKEKLFLNPSNALLSTFRATQADWQAYDFYVSKVALTLGGAFDQDLWQKLVVQLANVEPTVRHGAFALGFLFRHLDLSDKISECTCVHCSQALRHYNKSIAAFSTFLQRPPRDQRIDVAIISCLVFFCLEAYRMNSINAAGLISRGCWMIAGAPSASGSSTTAIDRTLLKTFDRLWLLANMFGRHVPRPRVNPPAMFRNFDTVEAARDALHDITALTQSLRVRAYQVQVNSTSDFEASTTLAILQKEQEPVVELLEDWRRRTQHLMGRRDLQPFSRTPAWYCLIIRYLITKIRTVACMNPSEMRDDDHVEDFQQLITTAEEGLAKFTAIGEAKRFSLEPSFLPALYFTACKCRQPTIRRKALELLCLAGVREGLWQKAELTCVAARVIELEEGIATLDVPNMPAVFSRPSLRFCDVLVDLNYRQDEKTLVHVTYLIYDAQSQKPCQTAEEILTVSDQGS
ncbi:hypothetical protein PV08_08082 [Exophiala spinifera]|uniref:Zn(2)-C6 fungal-type domain-containing protein n=1 Tax=Exophiala spinifera TaxID=91928 RepID=A0A0D2B2Q3_9EURO|nr:uncharacterized protein PV08_08082 [Exophiala spinifera]KIW12895.1 hypothetical protein PV08_08082 [Exophiala spinifera]